MKVSKKFIFTAIVALLVLAAVVLWFLFLLKKEVPDIEGEIIAPKEEAAEIGEFLEFPKEVQPLLQDSLDEALEDIEALEL